MTSRWPNRVFCFLVALTTVNVQNAGGYFAKLPKIDAIRARKLIAQQLILNKYIQNTAQSHRKNAAPLITNSLHFPHSENSKIPQWSDAKTNIRNGTAPARLHV